MGRKIDHTDPNCYLRLEKCPVCKKDFILQPNSIYKLDTKSGRKHYCGYNCYRKVYKEMYEAKELREKEKIKKELNGEFRI